MKNNFFNQIKKNIFLNKIFTNCNGPDLLSQVLLIFSVILIIIGFLFKTNFFINISFIVYCVSLYRTISTNKIKRNKENKVFLNYYHKYYRLFRIAYKRIKDIKKYRYFICPSCKQVIRAPRKKKIIIITCQKCKTRFERRT